MAAVLIVRGPGRASFISRDAAHLGGQEFGYTGPLCLPSLFLAVYRSRGVLGWFVDWHSLWACLFARILGRRCMVIAGGYDFATLPGLGYGLHLRPFGHWVAQATLRLAHGVLPVHESMASLVRCCAPWLPEARLKVIEHGVDADAFQPGTKERLVVTICSGSFERKGLDRFLEVTTLLPALRFVIVGTAPPPTDSFFYYLLPYLWPKNVRFTGYISDADLRDLLARASVYCQPSRHEGFGVAVAEAMLAGCIPVVTDLPPLRDMAEGIGYITAPEPEAIADAISEALAHPERGRLARTRVMVRWPAELRGRLLRRAFGREGFQWRGR